MSERPGPSAQVLLDGLQRAMAAAFQEAAAMCAAAPGPSPPGLASSSGAASSPSRPRSRTPSTVSGKLEQLVVALQQELQEVKAQLQEQKKLVRELTAGGVAAKEKKQASLQAPAARKSGQAAGKVLPTKQGQGR
uniref:Uncharacterized protein n=1 Tax=Eutreptiella gymnastica TaxID=73025 RepID=A0A7S1IY61_9EUGL|mmetsp:Transcript_52953/g.94461  ORF Transcript_52953/g.94461 Transcript_52953/m.94461 type:complete len:135 (+) Transcript_52953:40-444(+)